MYDYNNKSNEKQVKETVPTWNQNQLFPATILDVAPLSQSQSSPGGRWQPGKLSHRALNHFLELSFVLIGRAKHHSPSQGKFLPGAVSMCVCQVTTTLSDSLRPHGLQPTRLLCPWDSSGKDTGVGCHALLQRIFLTQGSNLCLLQLLHCRQTLPLSHWGSPGGAL